MNKHILASIAMATLVGCTSGTVVNSEGSPESELRWPDHTDTQFDHNTGTFPNLSNLNNVRVNMSRDELYDLIGRPHFMAGFHVREWNYLFYFNTPDVGTDGVSTCLYKVLFDKELRAKNYFWKPIDPENGVCPPNRKISTWTLSADALFPFDKGGLNDIKPAGRKKLDEFAETIIAKGNKIRLSIRGYTDEMGSTAYNLPLSQQRAISVAQYLKNKGVDRKNILSVSGLGESDPVVKDCTKHNRKQKIACLAPNRRVEIDTW